MENKNQETLLRVDHLCQYFGATKAVDDVSFEIKKGEVFGLVGESGCGKTTTGRSIIKLYNITSGSVFFKGIRIAAGKKSYKDAIEKAKQDYKTASKEHPENAAALKAEMDKAIAEQRSLMKQADADQKHCDKAYARQRAAEVREKYEALIAKASGEEKTKLEAEYKNELRKAKKTKLVTQIQMIFQDPIASLDPRMTVKEIISEGLVIQGERDDKVITQKVNEMLELVGLVPEHATRYPHEFSGGQRQRIGVARSVIMNPELIIADEPVSALDVSVQAQVINLLNELREKFGRPFSSSPTTCPSLSTSPTASALCTSARWWRWPVPMSCLPIRCTPTPGPCCLPFLCRTLCMRRSVSVSPTILWPSMTTPWISPASGRLPRATSSSATMRSLPSISRSCANEQKAEKLSDKPACGCAAVRHGDFHQPGPGLWAAAAAV